jgi:glycosyltransferase involved in cell wall biosynthesis
MSERRLVAACRGDQSAAAFLWGDVSSGLMRRLRHDGIFIAREKYNCGKMISKEIMARAYGGLDAMAAFPAHQYTPDLIAAENEGFAASDMIYCPSPMVAWSLRQIGVAEEKLVPTSYGFDPARFQGEGRALPEIDGPTFIFAGYICVRKGAHILLDAWRQAGVRGRLVLVGQIEPLIAERYADVLARDDVEHHSFARDVGAFYRSADYFIFPTLEEGGPQVTYEAAYCHLPSIVSQMGAGAILRDGEEGHIVSGDAVADWAEALVAADRERGTEAYRTLAKAARERAESFTWDRVGKQRREALLAKRRELRSV